MLIPPVNVSAPLAALNVCDAPRVRLLEIVCALVELLVMPSAPTVKLFPERLYEPLVALLKTNPCIPVTALLLTLPPAPDIIIQLSLVVGAAPIVQLPAVVQLPAPPDQAKGATVVLTVILSI